MFGSNNQAKRRKGKFIIKICHYSTASFFKYIALIGWTQNLGKHKPKRAIISKSIHKIQIVNRKTTRGANNIKEGFISNRKTHQAERSFLPLLLLLDKTERPPFVAILDRKPCLFFLFLLLIFTFTFIFYFNHQRCQI